MFNDTVQRKVYKLATSALFNFELFFLLFSVLSPQCCIYPLTWRQTGREYFNPIYSFSYPAFSNQMTVRIKYTVMNTVVQLMTVFIVRFIKCRTSEFLLPR